MCEHHPFQSSPIELFFTTVFYKQDLPPSPLRAPPSPNPSPPPSGISSESEVQQSTGGGGGGVEKRKRKRDSRDDESTEDIMHKHGGAYIKKIRTFEHKWLYEKW